MSDIEYIDGLFIKEPHENSPEFVKATISINRKKLGNWLRGKTEDWINIDVLQSKSGEWYAKVNNWKPEKKDKEAAPPAPEYDDKIPF